MTAAQMVAYIETRPRTATTRQLIRAALKHYWEIRGRKNPPLDVIFTPPAPRMVCKALDEDDARLLAKAARARHDLPGLAVLLGLYQALRRQEIATLRWDCFHSDWLTVTGKGSVTATIPVHPVIAEELLWRDRPSAWVFPGRKSGPCNPATIWSWVSQVAEDAGLCHVRPHQLRHTSIATVNDNTGDLRAAQDFARHANPTVTAGYTRTKAKRLRAAVDTIDY
jgi:integrase